MQQLHRLNNLIPVVALLALSTLLSACGGGGGYGPSAPVVTSITPLVATVNAPTTFAVLGTNLPTTAVLIPQDGTCAAATGNTATGFSQQCTFTSPGQKSLVIAVGSGYSFNVNVAASQYVKICNDGSREGTFACPNNPPQGTASNEWACTLDTLTNQMWEVKTAAVGLRNVNNQYTSFDDTTKPQKFVAGAVVPPTQLEIDASTNVVGYATALNDLAGSNPLCGSTKWRVPTLPELTTLVKGTVAPRIDAVYFPNTSPQAYITATPQIFTPPGAPAVTSTNSISVVDFNSGATNAFIFRETPKPLRLVSVPSRAASTSSTRLATGTEHACAIKADRTVVCWGAGTQGQLGNGVKVNSLVPVQVIGIGGVGTGNLSSVSALAAGSAHTCALRVDGLVYCWGRGAEGQLALGVTNSSTNPLIPVSYANGLPVTDVRAVAAGGEHTCAIRGDRTVVCWGSNSFGQLGNGTSGAGTKSLTPVDVVNLTDVSSITAGNDNTCATKTNGNVLCWGEGTYGVLGNSYNLSSSIPVNALDWPNPGAVLPALMTDASRVSTSILVSCAVRGAGTVSCWGYGSVGMRGDGFDQYSPSTSNNILGLAITPVVGLSDANGVVTGRRHACALRKSGSVACWGMNDSNNGRLGNGATAFYGSVGQIINSTPVAVVGVTDAIEISAGYEYTCVLKKTGKVACWGEGLNGKLGNRSNSQSNVPTEVVGLTL